MLKWLDGKSLASFWEWCALAPMRDGAHAGLIAVLHNGALTGRRFIVPSPAAYRSVQPFGVGIVIFDIQCGGGTKKGYSEEGHGSLAHLSDTRPTALPLPRTQPATWLQYQ
jgi:hypothetical protein